MNQPINNWLGFTKFPCSPTSTLPETKKNGSVVYNCNGLQAVLDIIDIILFKKTSFSNSIFLGKLSGPQPRHTPNGGLGRESPLKMPETFRSA